MKKDKNVVNNLPRNLILLDIKEFTKMKKNSNVLNVVKNSIQVQT